LEQEQADKENEELYVRENLISVLGKENNDLEIENEGLADEVETLKVTQKP
jgi:hypothetical protein